MIYIQFDDAGNITGVVDQDTPPDCANQIAADTMPGMNMMVDVKTKTLKPMITDDDVMGFPPSPPPAP